MKVERRQTRTRLSIVIAVALSFGGCGYYGEPSAPTRRSKPLGTEESNGGQASRTDDPADLGLFRAQPWKELREQNGQVLPDEPPFCAMYLHHELSEIHTEIWEERDWEERDWSIELIDEWGATYEKRLAEFKPITLVTAVWHDGRIIRSLDPDEGGPPFQEGRIENTQIVKLLASLEKMNVFEEPLRETRCTYVDISYWVIELNNGARSLLLECTYRHPKSEDWSTADRVRFGRIWKCINTWFEQLDLEEAGTSQEGEADDR